jgi:hypothetical protein
MEGEGTMVQLSKLLSLNGSSQFIQHLAAALIFSPLKRKMSPSKSSLQQG